MAPIRVDMTLPLSNREGLPDWGDLLERARDTGGGHGR